MKRYFVICLLLMSVIAVTAQTISVSAPSHVQVGENFRIAYIVNTQDIDGFRAGNIPDGIEVIAGPYTSVQTNYQMINGHTSSSSSVTYTYTMYAGKSGTFTIPAANAKVNGKTISSKPVKITVSGQAQTNRNGAPKMHDDAEDDHQMRQAGSAITGKDLFIKVSANKKSVHEQEPILLTYKVYTTVDLTQLRGEMPDLTGFHTQEVQLPAQKSFHVENVNGRAYRCVTWSQYVMYPQMTGDLEIPSITFNGIVVQQNRSVDPFEAFLNGGSGYVEVKREVVAPGLKIHVEPLPKRPANFSGGVGRFNISAQLNEKEVKAGNPVTLRVVVSGNGNLKLLKQPVVNFPKDFDKYDAKVTDKTKLTSNGLEGNMIYDFLAVPRNHGKYTIPAIEMTYYDTSANQYKTIKTQSFELNVTKGDGKSGDIANYADNLPKDIRGIKTGLASQQPKDHQFFGSRAYWLSLIIPLIAFIALLIAFRRRAVQNADIVKRRAGKASKVATKRLKKASQLMQNGKQSEFYDEVMRALFGYVGDKMNMPAEQLSRENISENLHQHNVDDETISKFVSALDECEFERYAPGDAKGNMNKTFQSAMTAIMNIEEVMKHSKSRRKASHATLILLVMLMISLSANAVTKKNADDEYKKGNYQQAIKDYQELLQKGPSAELYYNLGNAFFRTDNITQALLAYERAHALSPGDADINYNLQFARSKTIDKITPQSEMFFVTWFRSLVNFTSVDNWARTAIVSIVVVLILVLLYLFSPLTALRKIGFFGAIFFFLLFIFSNLFAWQQKRSLQDRDAAIVTASSVNVKKTPEANGTDQFVIHEGTRVNITDRSIRSWLAIRLDDGREGWIMKDKVEPI